MIKKGFSLVELMITVVVLSIGLVTLCRSFIISASTLERIHNRINAIKVLQEKMAEIQQEIKQKSGLSPCQQQERVRLGSRDAWWYLTVEPISEEDLEKELNELKMRIVWQEGKRQVEEVLVSYVPNKR